MKGGGIYCYESVWEVHTIFYFMGRKQTMDSQPKKRGATVATAQKVSKRADSRAKDFSEMGEALKLLEPKPKQVALSLLYYFLVAARKRTFSFQITMRLDYPKEHHVTAFVKL